MTAPKDLKGPSLTEERSSPLRVLPSEQGASLLLFERGLLPSEQRDVPEWGKGLLRREAVRKGAKQKGRMNSFVRHKR